MTNLNVRATDDFVKVVEVIQAGPIGPAGPAGQGAGATGPQGPQGPIGPQGPAGPVGAAGATGPQGPIGPAGADGAVLIGDGAHILTGNGVPSDSIGVDGDLYIDEDTSDVYSKAAGHWDLQLNIRGSQGPQGIQGPDGPQGPIGLTGIQGVIGLQGPQGPQGIDGRSFRTGTGVPSTSLGNDGDAYLNTVNADLYDKAGGLWTLRLNIEGPPGAAGPAGPAGADGAPGATGPAGADGADGVDGANGGNRYVFNTGTSGDPTAGKFLFNNASFVSVTQLSISETDADGAAISSLLARLDDSTSANKAMLLFKTADGTKGFAGFVTAALTDQGVYDTFPFTPITTWGNPANGDSMYLAASIVGDAGAAGAPGATGPAGTTGAAGAAGPQGPQGDPGPAGATGATGASGGGNKYTYNTATSGDPTAGKFLFNNATFASVTQLNISETDTDGAAISALLAAIDNSTSANKALITFKSLDGTKGFSGYITGALTDQGTYDTYPFTPVSTWGTHALNDVMYFSYALVGDMGLGSAGNRYLWNNAFSGDPGSGKFLFNNAFGSANQLNISETDADGALISALLAVMDDGTSVNKCFVIFKSLDGTKGFSGYITGTLTDAGTYDTFPFTPVSTWGTHALNDVMLLQFSQTGDAGNSGGGHRYRYNSTASSADPGTGMFAFNAAPWATAAYVFINETDADGASIATVLATLDDSTSFNKAFLEFKSPDGTKGFSGYVNGNLFDAGAYDRFPFTPIQQWGSISNNDVMILTWSLVGDAVNAAFKYNYNTAISGDPGTGKFLFNNVTPASATSISFSKTSAGTGFTLPNLLLALDDQGSVRRALVTLLKGNGEFAVVWISGAVVDNTTYVTCPCTVIETSGTVHINGDVFGVSFTPSPVDANATAAEYRSNTANRYLTPNAAWSAAATVDLGSVSGTVTIDFNSGLNFRCVLVGAVTFANPVNLKNGQSFGLWISENATGAFSIAFGTKWLPVGGAALTFNTTASKRNYISGQYDATLDIIAYSGGKLE